MPATEVRVLRWVGDRDNPLLVSGGCWAVWDWENIPQQVEGLDLVQPSFIARGFITITYQSKEEK